MQVFITFFNIILSLTMFAIQKMYIHFFRSLIGICLLLGTFSCSQTVKVSWETKTKKIAKKKSVTTVKIQKKIVDSSSNQEA
ncbi:MAG: hypothetical protein ACI86H_002962, partial [bacterium]